VTVGRDRWDGATAYEAFMGRWSRKLAAAFLAWLDAPRGRRWVDVGCGTGALSAAVLAQGEPEAIVGVDPSDDFVTVARAHVDDPRVRFDLGSAASIPVADGWADAVVAGLVLNFVPDLGAALAEMRRVAAPGAVIGAYVWDYGGEMQLIRRLFDAAIALDPAAEQHDEGKRFPICAPGGLGSAFEAAGIDSITDDAIEIPTVFRDFDDFWTPFLGGVGPAPAYVVSLDEDARDRLRERLHATLPIDADGSIHLSARAWAARGVVPGRAM
jgi:SAM-dependent methyltransferase